MFSQPVRPPPPPPPSPLSDLDRYALHAHQHHQHHHHRHHQHPLAGHTVPVGMSGPSAPRRRPTFHPLPRSSLQRPVQHVIPLPTTTPYHPSPGSVRDARTSSLGSRPEHILRRKTPNGTLAAGYDGTSIEWTSKPHAMKHILLPLRDRPADYVSPWSANMVGHHQAMPVQPDGRPSPLPWFHPSEGTSPGAWGRTGPVAMTTWEEPSAWQGLAAAPPARALDAMPNQTSTPPSGFFVVDASFPPVPAILPPTHQSLLGPTASNRAGPFGPYWPDGAFIPYRPAALRDPRFGPSVAHPAWAVDPTAHPPPVPDNAVPPWGHPGVGLMSDLMTTDVGQLLPPTLNLDVTPMTVHGRGASIPSSRFESHSSNHAIRPGGGPHSASPSSSSSSSSAAAYAPSPYPSYPPLPQFLHTSAPAPPPFSAGPSPTDDHSPHPDLVTIFPRRQTGGAALPPPPPPQSSQFKEKLLDWAHGVYVDLLAVIHQARMSTLGPSQMRFVKPSIYPKPPRPPSSLRSPSSSEEGGLDSKPQPPPTSVSGYSPGHHSSETVRGRGIQRFDQGENTDHRQDVISALPSGRRFDQATTWNLPDDGFRPSGLPPTLGAPPQPSSSFQATTANLSEGTMPINHARASTFAQALSALEMLTRLCVESGWRWIDGMLLAGCLAYGLGNFNDALGWYSRILEVDSNHVEAISNLAATLLSLNRREEAEQHWLRSVRLRPSYFEAVEHLIGILFNDHRGKEAVDIIDFVERSLRCTRSQNSLGGSDDHSDGEGDGVTEIGGDSTITFTGLSPTANLESRSDDRFQPTGVFRGQSHQPGFGSSGYAIPATDNGRILALVHAKGNMLYALGDGHGAAHAFEDVVLIAVGRRRDGLRGLIKGILSRMASETPNSSKTSSVNEPTLEPLLLTHDKALQTARLVFPDRGDLPGLAHLTEGMAKRAAVSTTSNSLLSLAKIFQDGLSSGSLHGPKTDGGVRDILALYYLSLSLHPSPSTANNVGILLASVQQPVSSRAIAPASNPTSADGNSIPVIPGVVPGSGIALALEYYNYGLHLDPRHAHLFTNLGSLLKDIGQLNAAVKMYEQAVSCDDSFDIALANLANAVKDQGRIGDAICYYRRAVSASPDFAEAVCGLANALNSVCDWAGRGGEPRRERWHVDERGMLVDAATLPEGRGGRFAPGWMQRVVQIVEKQLGEGDRWGVGILSADVIQHLLDQLEGANFGRGPPAERRHRMEMTLRAWAGQPREGAKLVRSIERAIRRLMWLWYQDAYRRHQPGPPSRYARPKLPASLSVPAAPTVLPFHTFTCPLSAKQIRTISQRNALRISSSTLRAHWLPTTVFRPPPPPLPRLRVGYVSSDFNNHPLAHLMQSVFGLHDPNKVTAFCYATTPSDQSVHREQIEREAPVFRDTSHWPAERLVKRIVEDGIHILVNLNGYTRGARNEIFAARPAPVQMSFMGFAGTLGAEWCDYLLADETAIPPSTLPPSRRRFHEGGKRADDVDVDHDDYYQDHEHDDDQWLYTEKIIFTRDTFFCCDHRQSAPDASEPQLSWDDEQGRRWAMRKELFPDLADDIIILANFNQLYKIDPATFRTWLRILSRVPRAVLWLLRFPELGERKLKQTAELWAGSEIASRVIFTDVAPKAQHISRARVSDLFLDTPECNAHTTAADVLWSGTPLLTFPRHEHKMCSRMAASILKGALPRTAAGEQAATELITSSLEHYENQAVHLSNELTYTSSSSSSPGRGHGRLLELRQLLYESRWTSALFDTPRWVRDLELAYQKAWNQWEGGSSSDIWL